jgi:hypothetical protein
MPLTLRNPDLEEGWYAGTQIWDSRARGCDARMRYERAPPEVASWVSNSRRVPEFADGCLPTQSCLDQGL